MKKELIENFPGLYKDSIKFLIGDGWMPLLWEISNQLEKEISIMDKALREDVYVVEVKEKYGSLNVYMSYGNDPIYKILDEAGRVSEEICEFCGKPGKLVGRKWHYVSCVEHRRNDN